MSASMSAVDTLSVEEALNKPVDEMITTKSESAESATTKPSSSVSSQAFENGGHHSETSQEGEDWDGDGDAVESSEKSLKEELAKVKEERNSYEAQYRGLLAKLSQMRSTLGDRLRQDAEELDRREQQIEALQSKSQELQETVETLKSELLTSHSDMERLTQEVDSVRQNSSGNQSERKSGEIKLRELQEMTERYRIDAESWESSCMEERAYREELALEIREVKREKDEAVLREAEERKRADREAQSAFDLQQVLEEFQSSQENEVQRALGDYQIKYDQVSSSLKEHKERTLRAESEAREYKEGWERYQILEKEVKDKNLLIGKLRHEG
jgi:chromosome segregation ATPase